MIDAESPDPARNLGRGEGSTRLVTCKAAIHPPSTQKKNINKERLRGGVISDRRMMRSKAHLIVPVGWWGRIRSKQERQLGEMRGGQRRNRINSVLEDRHRPWPPNDTRVAAEETREKAYQDNDMDCCTILGRVERWRGSLPGAVVDFASSVAHRIAPSP